MIPQRHSLDRVSPETPMPRMVSRVAKLEANVSRHLERMGFSW